MRFGSGTCYGTSGANANTTLTTCAFVGYDSIFDQFSTDCCGTVFFLHMR